MATSHTAFEQEQTRTTHRPHYPPDWIFLTCFWAVIFLLGSALTMNHLQWADDHWFREQINPVLSQYGLIAGAVRWVAYRAVTWQPRLFTELQIALLINHIGLWRVLNAGAMATLCTTIVYFASYRHARSRTLFSMLLVFALVPLLYQNVLFSGFYWFSGAINFTTPLAVMLLALVPFINTIRGQQLEIRRTPGSIIWGLWLLTFAAVAAYSEQTGLILATIGIAASIWSLATTKHLSKWLVIYLGWIVVNVLIFSIWNTVFSARGPAEIESFFPDFGSWGIGRLLVLGLSYANYHTLFRSGLVFLISSIMLTVCLLRHHRGSVRCLGIFPLVYSAYTTLLWLLPYELPVIPFVIPSNPHELWTGTGVSPLDWTVSGQLPNLIAMLAVLTFGVGLYYAFRTPELRFIGLLVFLASLASGYILAFSPTIFASGSRVFFVGDFLRILVAALLVPKFCHATHNFPGLRIGFGIGLGILGIIGWLRVLQLAWNLQYDPFLTSLLF